MWNDVQYHQGYKVNENGEIIDESGVVQKQYLQKNGYVYVWLKRGNYKHSVPVHRIVAIAFHGEQGYLDGKYVDHINTIRNDNRAENLRWVTPKENANNPLTKEKRKRND